MRWGRLRTRPWSARKRRWSSCCGAGDRLGIAYDYVPAWVNRRGHSALDAVGLSAAVSTALADAGLSCNVIAGYHRDDLLVRADHAPEALAVLSDLSRGARP